MNKTDDIVMGLIAEIDRRKKAITVADNPKWVTNCQFHTNPDKPSDSNLIPLHVESNVSKLINAAAAMLQAKESYEKAAKQLGVDNAPAFTWLGHSVDDWLHDFKARIGKIQIGKEKEKLKKLEDRLDKLVSPEQKAKLELEAIIAELG